MRKAKETQPFSLAPYSNDPILANYRFCNINREHDAVTRWIHDNVRTKYFGFGQSIMVTHMTICRVFNEPQVLKEVYPLAVFNLDVVEQRLRQRRAKGEKLFRGAYMMPPHGAGKDKDALTDWMRVIRSVAALPPVDTTAWSLDWLAKALLTVSGLGPFLVNQICTDMRYMPEWGKNYNDWSTFILCGPGTRRGMNRYFERDINTPGSDATFTELLLDIRDNIQSDIDDTLRGYFQDPNNLSNSFCEFDKYERATEQVKQCKEITLRHYKR